MYYELLNSIYKYYYHNRSRPPRPRTSSCRSTAGCRSCPQSRSGWTWTLGEKRFVIIGHHVLEDLLFFNILYMIVHVVFCYCLSLQSNYTTSSDFDQNSPSFVVCKAMYTKTWWSTIYCVIFYIFAHFSAWHLRRRGNSSNKGFCCCLKYETHLWGNNSFPLWRYC